MIRRDPRLFKYLQNELAVKEKLDQMSRLSLEEGGDEDPPSSSGFWTNHRVVYSSSPQQNENGESLTILRTIETRLSQTVTDSQLDIQTKDSLRHHTEDGINDLEVIIDSTRQINGEDMDLSIEDSSQLSSDPDLATTYEPPSSPKSVRAESSTDTVPDSSPRPCGLLRRLVIYDDQGDDESIDWGTEQRRGRDDDPEYLPNIQVPEIPEIRLSFWNSASALRSIHSPLVHSVSISQKLSTGALDPDAALEHWTEDKVFAADTLNECDLPDPMPGQSCPACNPAGFAREDTILETERRPRIKKIISMRDAEIGSVQYCSLMRRDYRISVDDTVAKAERIRAAKKAEKQVRKSAKRLGEAEEQEKTATTKKQKGGLKGQPRGFCRPGARRRLSNRLC